MLLLRHWQGPPLMCIGLALLDEYSIESFSNKNDLLQTKLYSEKCTTLVYFTASTPLFSRGPQFGNVPPNETENDNKRPCARQQTESVQRNAPRLTGGTPATRRRKVGGRSGSPHRGRRARRGVSGAPNRRAVRPARGGAGALHGLLINSCADSMLQWI